MLVPEVMLTATQTDVRELAITTTAVVTALGGVGAIVVGVPKVIRGWLRALAARVEREEATTAALASLPALQASVERLEREVVKNGDPADEGRPLRAIVRYQGSQITVQTGMVEQMNRQLAAGAEHFQEHDRRFEDLGRRLETIERRGQHEGETNAGSTG